MKFTLSLLKSFINIKKSFFYLIEIISSLGLEVEKFSNIYNLHKKLIFVKIIAINKHPQNKNLSICIININNFILQIICISDTLIVGDKLILSKFCNKITIEGIKTYGFICSNDNVFFNKNYYILISCNLKIPISSKYLYYIKSNNIVIYINITPNRGDYLSINGIVRDLNAKRIGKLKKKFYAFNNININKLLKQSGQLPIKAKNNNFFYQIAFCLIRNKENYYNSVLDFIIQNKLLYINKKNVLNNLSTFTCYEFGRPNIIYDANKIKNIIIIRKSKHKEIFISPINFKKYIIPNGILVISDVNKILSISGIINDFRSIVNFNTKNIILEISNYSTKQILFFTKKLKISNEMTYRFERRIDFNNTKSFIYYLYSIINSYYKFLIINWQIYYGKNINYINNFFFNYLQIEQILGWDINKYKTKVLFNNLGFYKDNNLIYIPSWRQGDIEDQIDLSGEISKFSNTYKKLKNNFKVIVNKNTFHKNNYYEYKVKKTLINRGVNELITFSFIKKINSIILGHLNNVIIKNPISYDFSVMRSTLLSGLLTITKKNISKGFENFSFFELGKIFIKNKKKIKEEVRIEIIRVGHAIRYSLLEKKRSFDFFDIKNDLISILNIFNINYNEILFKRKKDNIKYCSFHSFYIYLNNIIIGSIGKIKKIILKKFYINNNRIFTGELFIEKILKKKN